MKRDPSLSACVKTLTENGIEKKMPKQKYGATRRNPRLLHDIVIDENSELFFQSIEIKGKIYRLYDVK